MTEDQAGRPITKPLRGPAKRALIMDLAAEDDQYEALSEKHGLTYQGVVQFVARNREVINRAKQDMTSELAGLWSTNKPDRIADAESDLDLVNERLQDETLTEAMRNRYLNTKDKLRGSIADECGQLYTRTQVQIESNGSPLTNLDVIAMDEDGNFHGVVDR